MALSLDEVYLKTAPPGLVVKCPSAPGAYSGKTSGSFSTHRIHITQMCWGCMTCDFNCGRSTKISAQPRRTGTAQRFPPEGLTAHALSVPSLFPFRACCGCSSGSYTVAAGSSSWHNITFIHHRAEESCAVSRESR